MFDVFPGRSGVQLANPRPQYLVIQIAMSKVEGDEVLFVAQPFVVARKASRARRPR